MGRIVRDWKPVQVETAEVAPHRYLWSGVIGADGQPLNDIALAEPREIRSCIPYKAGDVVYIERNGEAVKALIYIASFGRDRWGDRREWYKVQPATKDGTFSKLWEMAHPGFIQRGYKRAGLATDVPE